MLDRRRRHRQFDAEQSGERARETPRSLGDAAGPALRVCAEARWPKRIEKAIRGDAFERDTVNAWRIVDADNQRGMGLRHRQRGSRIADHAFGGVPSSTTNRLRPHQAARKRPLRIGRPPERTRCEAREFAHRQARPIPADPTTLPREGIAADHRTSRTTTAAIDDGHAALTKRKVVEPQICVARVAGLRGSNSRDPGPDRCRPSRHEGQA